LTCGAEAGLNAGDGAGGIDFRPFRQRPVADTGELLGP